MVGCRPKKAPNTEVERRTLRATERSSHIRRARSAISCLLRALRVLNCSSVLEALRAINQSKPRQKIGDAQPHGKCDSLGAEPSRLNGFAPVLRCRDTMTLGSDPYQPDPVCPERHIQG